MGMHKVGAATVQVDRGTQVADRHRRTLHVPTRSAPPPGGIPCGLVHGGRLPQQRVQRRALARVVRKLAALRPERPHGVVGEPAQRTQSLRARDVEEHAVAGPVGPAVVQEVVDEPPDSRYGAAGPRFGPGRQVSQGSHVVVEPADDAEGQIQVVDTPPPGCAQHVVVHIGDVADVADLVAPVGETALQHVEGHVGGRMSEVGGVVRRDTARVEPDHDTGLEGHHRPSGRVVEPHRGHPPLRHPALPGGLRTRRYP